MSIVCRGANATTRVLLHAKAKTRLFRGLKLLMFPVRYPDLKLVSHLSNPVIMADKLSNLQARVMRTLLKARLCSI